MKIIFQKIWAGLFYSLVLAISVQSAPSDLDLMFGIGGKVIYRFNDREDTFQDVVIQPDNKIVVAGKRGDGRLIVIRYNADGGFDTSFASGGILVLPSLSGALCEAMALQSDGKRGFAK